MVSIGIAICCYHGHLPQLKNLLDSIEQQTRKPDDVVISCSSTLLEDVPYKRDMYSFPFRMMIHPERKNAAQNRNYAASQLMTDIICFFDADDVMHPQRLDVIATCFEMDPAVVIFLHNTELRFSDDLAAFMDFPRFSTAEIHRNQLGQCPWGSTILYPPLEGHIANGHASVRRFVYQDMPYLEDEPSQGREDTKFTTQIILHYPLQTAYCMNILSRYSPSGTGGYRS